jgi:hypothetical protein
MATLRMHPGVYLQVEYGVATDINILLSPD